MMDIREHFYRDDPARLPADGRTMLGDVDYFFLGNGLLQAAVQVCHSAAATPLALLLMDPDRLLPKQGALTFDSKSGLADTRLCVRSGVAAHFPQAAGLDAGWTEIDSIPAVKVRWLAGDCSVQEKFYFPDRITPRLLRSVRVRNLAIKPQAVRLETGCCGRFIRRELRLAAGEEVRLIIAYRFARDDGRVMIDWADNDLGLPAAEAVLFWESGASISCSDPLLDHLWRAAALQLPAALSQRGVMDGSIWQYNREWPRDQSVVAQALVMTGRPALARVVLDRLLDEFVSADGDCLDSSERRPPDEVELDQNGYLLAACETYSRWTGDWDWIKARWDKIRALADFPLRREFVHPESGMLHNRREFWERHAAHGIEEGFELMHQMWVALGLEAAARLARVAGKEEPESRWREYAARLRRSMLRHRRFKLVENGRLIKRRRLDGSVQAEIALQNPEAFPGGIPLKEPGRHLLDPDASSFLAVATGFVDPRSLLARKTLAAAEVLWNQRWSGGGYGRYHVSSEPDSPGPWPFPSLFAARAYQEAGNSRRVWRVLRWLGGLPGSRAGSFFEFYGPRPSPPFPQVGIIPWTWAEIVLFFVHHLLGVRPGEPQPRRLCIRPRLLSGMAKVDAELLLAGRRLRLRIRRSNERRRGVAVISGRQLSLAGHGLDMPLPETDMDLEIVLPGRSAPRGKT